MAVVCARCATQNPDGNQFCIRCGAPLTASPPQTAMPVGATAAAPFAAAPPPAGVMPGPPPGPPPSYQSPYYAPAAGAAPPGVHRTPWVLIISVIVGLVVIMGGIGTVAAFTLGKKSNTSQTSGVGLSSPSPAGSPSPIPSPSPTPSSSTGGTVSSGNNTVTVVDPTGWNVVNKDNESVSLESPNSDGTITIASGPMSPPQSAQTNKDQIDQALVAQYPDAKQCAGSKVTNGSIGGVSGIAWDMCFTLTSSASSIQAAVALFVGANASGSVYYIVEIVTEASNLNTFLTEAKPILDGGISFRLK